MKSAFDGSAGTPARFKEVHGGQAAKPRSECPRSSSLEARSASVIQPRVRRTLGLRCPHRVRVPNPNGVLSIVVGPTAHVIPCHGRNPVGVRGQRGVGDSLPRVAASPQPWAQIQNPVGIQPNVRILVHACGTPAPRRVGSFARTRHFVSLEERSHLHTQASCLPSSEARRASVIEPRVRRTLGDEQTHNLSSPNPNGVPSILGGLWS
jgi:hypothetical protein